MTKKLMMMFAAAVVAFGAFADGDDNVTVLVSTKGPDRYLGGEVVMDGKLVALNGYGEVADGVAISAGTGCAVVGGGSDGKSVSVFAEPGSSGFYKVIRN